MMRTVGIMGYNLKYVPSPNVVGKVMKQNNLGWMRRVNTESSGDVKIWVIRDIEKYHRLLPRELYRQYVDQIRSIKNITPLREVG